MKKIVCFGEVLLRLSAPGKELLLQSRALDVNVGGAETNVAVSLARFGNRAQVVTVLPNNSLGQGCLGEIRKHGVDTSAVLLRDGRMGVYFLTHGAGHRPAEVLYDRAQSAFSIAPAASIDWQPVLTDAEWLHVSGITPALTDESTRALFRAVEAARAAKVKVSFDCNFRAKLWGERAPQAPKILRDLCSYATLIFGDERDIEFMFEYRQTDSTNRRKHALAKAFAAFPSLQWIAHTERARQAVDVQHLCGALHERTQSHVTKSYPLQGIVDRIGGGDAFAAGVLHGLMNGFAAQRTIDFGVAAGCLKHSIPGDFNLVGVQDVEAVLSEVQTDVKR